MDRVREQRPFCSLRNQREDTGVHHHNDTREGDRERRYTSSSADRGQAPDAPPRVPTQQSYSSSETLHAFEHEPARMLFGRAADMVHEEREYTRTGQTFSLRQLGFCERSSAARRGPSHPLGNYREKHEPVSPERSMALWGNGPKSAQNSSCLSSRSNSALTLTDTEMDNKSDTEMGECSCCWRCDVCVAEVDSG
ncbi:unnamed protein product [Knipowitschia caucasica]